MRDHPAAWVAPAAASPDGPLTGDERPILEGYLAWQRSTLLAKCAGLTGEQLAQRTVPASNLSLLGLVRHLAKVERVWFTERIGGAELKPMYGSAKDADFDDLDPTRAEEDHARFVEECRRSDVEAAGHAFDETIEVHGEVMSVRLVFVHMISEYARHNGHADLLRESLDGATG